MVAEDSQVMSGNCWAEMVEACNPTYLVWWIEQGFSPLPVVQRQLEIFSEKIMPEFVG